MSRLPGVLVVGDRAEDRDAIVRMLPRDRYAWETAPSAAPEVKGVAWWTFDVVIAQAGVAGFAVLDRIRQERAALPVILVSETGRTQEAVDAIKRGAFHYLAKPFDEGELRKAVDEAVALRSSCSSERRPPPPAVHASLEIVGSGPAMAEVRDAIRLVASSTAPALITGESGVGKELVACAVHAESPRRGQPFVAVNASAIPADLLEAELFGHVRGGFTGAAQTRKGLLTEASGGTLFLDEIGDMPLDLQAKILRVLQFGEVRPVGSDRVHHVDVRVIAATHRDLPMLVREGRFREDLYYRLNVLPVAVPPLRERREDIPALVAHQLAQARLRNPASPVRSVSPDALEILMAAPWPGNVRELASVVERLVVFGRQEVIEARHVALLAPDAKGARSTLPVATPPSDAPWTLRRVLQAYTDQVLAETNGDKQRAAEILDVDLSTLYRWQRARRGEAVEGITLVDGVRGRVVCKGAASRARRARGAPGVPQADPLALDAAGDVAGEVPN